VGTAVTIEDQSDAPVGVTAGPATADVSQCRRPLVTIKIAQTLDGRIATRTGQSQWITSEGARALAHELRATHDAVLVGIGTVLHDNPRLTVRMVDGPDPLRIVVDSNLRIPLDSYLLAEQPERTICLAAPGASADQVRAIEDRGARVIYGIADPSGLNLGDGLCRLAKLGIRSVMVEGGAGIVTSLLRARLVDRLVVCIAPMILGTGLDAVGDLGLQDLARALRFKVTSIRQLGPDIVFDGQVDRAALDAPD
jgi:5-amino-6-(5-phosphoribosylamino)uracil reductase/diaminohydroxyphosphoribosylaminopyrimidine deaminase/5-amino-6-(5-phosphoribosylamino)uracil reductase